MLSKLRHVGVVGSLSACECNRYREDLQNVFGSALVGLRPVAGGTLGICFQGELYGRPRFFKTHAMSAGSTALKREAVLLSAAGKDHVDPQIVDVPFAGGSRTWLHMKVLRPCNGLNPDEVRNMISHYELHLAKLTNTELTLTDDNIYLLLKEAEDALVFLAANSMISKSIERIAHQKIDGLQLSSGEWRLQLCHGDLGPANILLDENVPVVIDWEDAFWGIAGYDYLFWLTFFSNRKWLVPAALGHTPWGRSIEVAMMVAILLLKSRLSVQDGSYRRNIISFDQRLSEVIDLE